MLLRFLYEEFVYLIIILYVQISHSYLCIVQPFCLRSENVWGVPGYWRETDFWEAGSLGIFCDILYYRF